MEEFVLKAVDYAHSAHKGQFRKGTKIPYIIHPLNVFETLHRLDFSLNIQIAGLFHDLIEDTKITAEDITKDFNEEITGLVISTSEKREAGVSEKKTWKQRKLHTIEFLSSNNNLGTIAISISDKLDNGKSLLLDKNIIGEKVWERFNAPYENQKWYYSELNRIFNEKSEMDTRIKFLSEEFNKVVLSVFS
ncbi:MAG: bifunctional (p)ppGpp synthetase/guanosine-3',5'-bis(diphosphate) 3'-pyrophosphohydrolase [Leptospiraceae bacterium]|nr:bifunctional (p)ppGpp synthetase/guanosine-3',5'-bis(diphosphate) 3'-pyrophosphohydrolase [Leptospiraceae bacterium]